MYWISEYPQQSLHFLYIMHILYSDVFLKYVLIYIYIVDCMLKYNNIKIVHIGHTVLGNNCCS